MTHAARSTRHEARILVMAMIAVCSSVALAMPTQQELKKAQPLVAELMAPIMDDFKAKRKTAAEVADVAVKYAGEAETEAAKFMLYRSSIPYYVRGEAYDKAADAVELMKTNVKDVPASVIEEIISKATVRATAKKAPRLFELYRQAKAQSVAEKDVAAFRAKIKKNPGSLPTIRNLAEALATSGDWDAALKEFAKLKDGAAQIAKKELDGSAKSAELGEFWWSYKPTYENAEDTFKIHAAFYYRKALAAGEITGLKKPIVEQRIKEYANVTGGEGGGAAPIKPKLVATEQLTYVGYLTKDNILLWEGVSLNDIQSFTATMAGGHVSHPGKAVGHVVASGDGWKSVQFQLVDGENGQYFLKCVYARFEQRGREIRGYVQKAAVADASVAIGTDFKTVKSAKDYCLCFKDDGGGYGIKDLVVTVGGKGAAAQAPAAKDLYCVIDLSGGPDAKKYPVSYLNDMPKGGWSDEYKTTKLVLRRIEPGMFMMGAGKGRHQEKLDKPFYLGVFEVTQKQWELVMGNRPSYFGGPSWRVRPVDQVSYDTIRGKQEGAKWPASDAVDGDSFLGIIRQKSGQRFDLPTQTQWEYACRAGTETDFYNGKVCINDEHDSSLDGLARYAHTGGWNESWGANNLKSRWSDFWKAPDRNCDTNNATAAVGTYQSNQWGLYDMLGNVREWCLQKDDKGMNLGGCWIDGADACKVYSVNQIAKHRGRHDFGLRLCLPLAGGAATQTK